MPPLAIDSAVAEFAAARLNGMVRLLAVTREAIGMDATAGSLDDTHLALRVLDELCEELTFTARVLSTTAADATAADALVVSLLDGVGAVARDLADPTPVWSWLGAGEQVGVGHFGYLPLFGPTGVPSPDDVRQGALGDCFLMAAMAAIAQQDPSAIRRMITDHGNGTYTVHLASGDVTVDDQLPMVFDDSPGPAYAHPAPAGALWPAIIEKAVALAAGGDYEAINGLQGNNSFDHLIPQPGWVGSWRDPGLDDADLTTLQAVVDNGHPAVALSVEDFGFGNGHAWTVVAVTGAGATAAVTLRNPWGRLGMERDEDGDVVYDAEHLTVDGEEVLPTGGDGDMTFDDPSSPYITVPADVFLDQFAMTNVASLPAAPRAQRS